MSGFKLNPVKCVVWALLLAVIVLGTNIYSHSQQMKILYAFNGAPDGFWPFGPLTLDRSGNLLGVTNAGGTYGKGTVFKLTKPTTSGGAWTESILYNFGTTPTDGEDPLGNLVWDAYGNLYGTAGSGGSLGGGNVFELSPPTIQGNPWTFLELHAFPKIGNNASSLPCGLLLSRGVRLFGTTKNGGLGYGTVFVLTAPSTRGGTWTTRTIYTFTGDTDGQNPEAGCNGLTADAQGNLYGTSVLGGDTGAGAVFKLSPPPHYSGNWVKTTLHSFSEDASDGCFPYGGLTFDSAGNLYGTASAFGPYNQGIIFQLVHVISDIWDENILYSFGTTATDGYAPWSRVVFDKAGIMYGTTASNKTNYDGLVWKLAPPSSSGGSWTETVLHTFTSVPDGSRPETGVILGPGGALYGTTISGGNAPGYGTVYQILP